MAKPKRFCLPESGKSRITMATVLEINQKMIENSRRREVEKPHYSTFLHRLMPAPDMSEQELNELWRAACGQ